jgi:glycosyltransferase involved in cell wall biosynthesis
MEQRTLIGAEASTETRRLTPDRADARQAERRSAQLPSVLFINRSYWPDCEATGQLLTELCEDLGQSMPVSVLAGQPNHNLNHEHYVGKGVERRNDVSIYRSRHTRFKKTSFFGRALNMLTFLASAAWRSLTIPRHDVVVVETDPFLLAFLGSAVKRFRRSQLVIYLQDVYPDIALALGKVREGLLVRVLRKLLHRAYTKADRIVVLSDDMRDRLLRSGVDAQKIVCISNWIDTDTVYPVKEDNHFRTDNGVDDRFVVMYSGNIGLTQELDTLIDVATELKDREDIVFMLVGEGASKQRLAAIVAKRKLTNVRFLPYQPREHLAQSLSAADLHIVSMHPAIAGCLVPSKIYGIFATGTPVLAVVPRAADVFQLVRDAEVGASVEPGDAEAIKNQIVDFADGKHDCELIGLRARKLAEEEFSRKQSVAKFHQLFQELSTTDETPTAESEFAPPIERQAV